ncbi:MAG TPA: hypothetical protein DDZ89_08430 [Clostridiales bacterium]|nr:hypothetical protein [Clostridiales bacterium]
MRMDRTKKITFTGIMTALVFIATFVIKIPIPATEGYIHLGDCMVFLAALLLGWKYGAFAAGVGSMLADIIGGYAHWALPTLIIKALMAILVAVAVNLVKTRNKIAFCGLTALSWTLFITFMRRVLSTGLIGDRENLMVEVGAETDAQLTNLANVSYTVLYVSAFVVIAIAVVLWFYFKKNNKSVDIMYIPGLIASGLWMVAGYYLASLIMYQNPVVPIFSIPANLLQFVAGFVLAMVIYAPLKKTFDKLTLES